MLNSKWIPPSTLDLPASASAAEKLAYSRARPPGAESVARRKGIASRQKKPRRTVLAAPLNELCPDQCSGEVPMPPARGDQLGSDGGGMPDSIVRWLF